MKNLIIIILTIIFTHSSNAQLQLDNKMRITSHYDIMNPNEDIHNLVYDIFYNNITTESVSIYYDYDIITIFRLTEEKYEVICEICSYSVALFNLEDIKSFIYWINEYPIDFENKYSNKYYQELIEEKIWE